MSDSSKYIRKMIGRGEKRAYLSKIVSKIQFHQRMNFVTMSVSQQ